MKLYKINISRTSEIEPWSLNNDGKYKWIKRHYIIAATNKDSAKECIKKWMQTIKHEFKILKIIELANLNAVIVDGQVIALDTKNEKVDNTIF